MARLFIPACGDRIILIQPWHFKLYLESRNLLYAQAMGYSLPHTGGWDVFIPGTQQLAHVDHIIRTRTILECDRVYVRSTSKSASDPDQSYDSITWKVILNDKPIKKQRFWVKLSDCSNLEFDESSVSKYRDRK